MIKSQIFKKGENLKFWDDWKCFFGILVLYFLVVLGKKPKYKNLKRH